MHEIITIQVGSQANFVATHFWNTQESYFTYDSSLPPSAVDHDVHFRPGLNPLGEDTFTPRTLIYDLKSGFGRLRKRGGLYEEETTTTAGDGGRDPETTWKGKTSLQQDPQIPISEYQENLDQGNLYPGCLSSKTVHYWSDYNRVYYHPKSIVQLNEYDFKSSSSSMQKYETGEEVFRSIDSEESLLDRDFRSWVEECDQLQGVQFLTSSDDAWAGFTGRYLEALRDEFGKKSIWTWGIGSSQEGDQKLVRSMKTSNAANFLANASAQASLYVPVTIPSALDPKYLQLDKHSEWSTSALLSAAIETVTLPSRLRSGERGRGSLDRLEAALNTNGSQNIAQLLFSAYDPDSPLTFLENAEQSKTNVDLHDEEVEDVNRNLELDIDLSTFPIANKIGDRIGKHNHIFGGVECVRGLLRSSADIADVDLANWMRKKKRLMDMPFVERYPIRLFYPIVDSYPPIFKIVTQNRISARAALSTSTRLAKELQSLHQVSTPAASFDEREALGERLTALAEAYQGDWSSDEDDDLDE